VACFGHLVHLSAGGTRIKTLRSHLSPADLRRVPQRRCPRRAVPAAAAAGGQAVEVERPVSRSGLVSLGPHRLLAAEILAGQLVGIRIEPGALMFYDPATRVLLRTRPSPLTSAEVARLRGARPAGPPPQPSRVTVPVSGRPAAIRSRARRISHSVGSPPSSRRSRSVAASGVSVAPSPGRPGAAPARPTATA
jgi:hypothetical protein